MKEKLKRQELANKYYGYHNEINIGTKDNVIRYLDEINKFLDKYEYTSDSNFVFCGSKKIIHDEIIDILNGNRKEENPLYFILESLEEFMCNYNFINLKEDTIFKNRNDEYIKSGYICLEEKKYIGDLINNIKRFLNTPVDTSKLVDEMIIKLDEISDDRKITITSLIDRLTYYKFNDKELTEIYKKFIKKCSDNGINLNYSIYSNERTGLIYNIPFTKAK